MSSRDYIGDSRAVEIIEQVELMLDVRLLLMNELEPVVPALCKSC